MGEQMGGWGEANDSSSEAQPVRNRQAPVLIFGSEAQQDFKKIGSIVTSFWSGIYQSVI
jgi:hypothetical protein